MTINEEGQIADWNLQDVDKWIKTQKDKED